MKVLEHEPQPAGRSVKQYTENYYSERRAKRSEGQQMTSEERISSLISLQFIAVTVWEAVVDMK